MADPMTYSLLKGYANENRRKPTEAESVLWGYLKGNQCGAHFRRQHIIGQFIADTDNVLNSIKDYIITNGPKL